MDAIPQKIGKYTILEKIGEGGFGVVYKGKDPFIKRLVAVKTCNSENEQIQQRFFREAEIAGNLHHANVVTIHDFGVEGETPYLVQEFLTGEDLDVLIKKPGVELTPETKVLYLRGVAEGLRYAHANGVIHRDIKPANIRVLDNGRVKVMDFGIAKLKDQESQLTQTGMALGTVAYMSPEQLKGLKIDHRADIFSYGVLAYELISGARPFRAETVSSLFYQLLHEEPDPIELDDLPPGLTAIVQRCLEKDREVRYQDFEEVIADLDAIVSDGADLEEDTVDPFLPGVQNEAAAAAQRLQERARRSLEADDLAAAAATIEIARRKLSHALFDERFADLVAEMEGLQTQEAEARGAEPDLPPELQRQISEINLKLVAEDHAGALRLLTEIEREHANHPSVRAIRQRLDAARGPVGPPPPPPLVQQPVHASAERKPLPLIAAALVILVLVGALAAYFVFRGEDSPPQVADGGTGEPPPLNGAPPDPGGEDPGGDGSSGAATGDDSETEDPTTSTTSSARPQDGGVTPSGGGSGVVADDDDVSTTSTTTVRPTSSVRPTPTSTTTRPTSVSTTTTTAKPVIDTPTIDIEAMRAQNDIRSSLSTYQFAWESLDHEQINSIHPAANLKRKDVRLYRTASVGVSNCEFEIDGNSAVATCQVTRTLNPKDGSPTTERFSGFRLSKQGTRWVIDALIP